MALIEARALPILPLLNRVSNRIETVGIELEGLWPMRTERYANIVADRSLYNRLDYVEHSKTGEMLRVGEVSLGPMYPASVAYALSRCYPVEIDKTCGLHVHMGFRNLRHYEVLMVPEFQETVLAYLLEWAEQEQFAASHPIWKRLQGKSTFCTKDFWPDAQSKKKNKSYQRDPGHRYTAIHYCGRFRTVECRVLPMFATADMAIRAVHKIFDIVNACIVMLGSKRERPYTLEVPDTPYTTLPTHIRVVTGV